MVPPSSPDRHPQGLWSAASICEGDLQACTGQRHLLVRAMVQPPLVFPVMPPQPPAPTKPSRRNESSGCLVLLERPQAICPSYQKRAGGHAWNAALSQLTPWRRMLATLLRVCCRLRAGGVPLAGCWVWGALLISWLAWGWVLMTA